MFRIENRKCPEMMESNSKIPVLLVEDNPVNQRVAVMMLQKLGFQPDLASDGLQALKMVKEKALRETTPYKVIFLDIFLPDIDGSEICRRIRMELPMKHQPFIVALTADESQENLKHYIEDGMDAILHKPLKMNELQEVIDIFQKKLLILKTQPEEIEWRSTGEVLHLPTLQKWQEMLGGRDSFRNVVSIYVKDARALFASIERGVAEDDWKLVHRNAHSLKSTSANLGALGLASVLEELELIAYENLTGDFPHSVTDLIHQARDCLNKVVHELEIYVQK